MSEPTPITDPLELRDVIAGQRFNAAKRAGLEPDYAAIRDEAQADLIKLERVDAEGDLPTASAPSPVVQEERRERSAADVAQMAAESGATFVRRPVADLAPTPKPRLTLAKVLERIESLISWLPPAQRQPGRNLLMVMMRQDVRSVMRQTPEGFAIALRYQQLLSAHPHEPGKGKAQESFIYPKYAKALGNEIGWKLKSLRHYRGLTVDQQDAEFLRRVVQVCNRSTHVLGPWWVK